MDGRFGSTSRHYLGNALLLSIELGARPPEHGHRAAAEVDGQIGQRRIRQCCVFEGLHEILLGGDGGKNTDEILIVDALYIRRRAPIVLGVARL